MAKLTANTEMVLQFLQANDKGDGVSIAEIADSLGKTTKQVLPVITTVLAKPAKDGSRGPLLSYVKRTVEGMEKPVGYAVLNDEGISFVNPAE